MVLLLMIVRDAMRYVSLILQVLVLLVGVTTFAHAESRIDCNVYPDSPSCKPAQPVLDPTPIPQPKVSVGSRQWTSTVNWNKVNSGEVKSDTPPQLGQGPQPPVLIPEHIPQPDVSQNISKEEILTSTGKGSKHRGRKWGMPRFSHES